VLKELGDELYKCGTVRTDEACMTTKEKVFAVGDMHTGQSLVVRAISEGRKAAHHTDKYIMGKSDLPMI